MSYEGYIQTLCEKGHAGPDFSCYSSSGEIKNFRCAQHIEGVACGAPVGWSNSVDDTNCDSQGYHFLEQLTESVTKECNLGHQHVWTAATFKPSKNAYWYDQEKGWVETQQHPCPDCGKPAWLNIRKDDPSDTWNFCGECENRKAREAWEARQKAEAEQRAKAEKETWHCNRCDKDVAHLVLLKDESGTKTECTRCQRTTWR